MDRFTLIVTGGVVALIGAALVAAILVRGAAATPPDLSTPGGTVLAYALAQRKGDSLTAWDLLAPAEQDRLDRDRFLARTANSTGDNVYLTTEDEQVDADGLGASVVLVRTYGSSALFGTHTTYNTRSTVRLVRTDQNWRISVPPDAYGLSLARDTHP
jgi:hypothetical protein